MVVPRFPNLPNLRQIKSLPITFEHHISQCGVFRLAQARVGQDQFPSIGAGGFQTLNGAIVSHLTDPEYFGRVVSLTFLAFATSSIIALPIGYIADAIGERHTITATGIIVTAITMVFFLLERATGGGHVPAPVTTVNPSPD